MNPWYAKAIILIATIGVLAIRAGTRPLRLMSTSLTPTPCQRATPSTAMRAPSLSPRTTTSWTPFIPERN